MSRKDAGGGAAAGFGVAFLLTGAALLLQEFDLLSLRWSFVLAIVVITAGVAVVLSGVMGARRSRSVVSPSSSGLPHYGPGQ